jgi:hypothetical protein
MSTADAYSAGYYIGATIFIAIFSLIFWFVGRWGWIGLIIRVVCAALIALKILQVLTGR